MMPPVIDIGEGHDLPIDARAIEDELAHLWRQAADSAGGGLVRASSLSLLVPLGQAVLAEQTSQVLRQVAVEHPCRAIVVSFEDAEPRARLAAHYRQASSGRPPSYWEEVQLQARPADLARVISAAASLVSPNLPVQVWWPGDADLTSLLFRRAVEIGDRVIVDSAHFSQPLSAFGDYADCVESERGTVGFTDLNWRRLEAWRLLLAEFFDDPGDRVYLNYIEAIVVGYERAADGSPGGYAQTLLLIGWLASRLGWTVAAERVGRFQDLEELVFDDGGRWVRVELRRSPVVDDHPPGLVSTALSATHDGKPASFTVECANDNATAVAQVEGARREVSVALPTAVDARLLGLELAGLGRDRIYEDALQIIRQLARRTTQTTGAR